MRFVFNELKHFKPSVWSYFFSSHFQFYFIVFSIMNIPSKLHHRDSVILYNFFFWLSWFKLCLKTLGFIHPSGVRAISHNAKQLIGPLIGGLRIKVTWEPMVTNCSLNTWQWLADFSHWNDRWVAAPTLNVNSSATWLTTREMWQWRHTIPHENHDNWNMCDLKKQKQNHQCLKLIISFFFLSFSVFKHNNKW